VYGGTLEPQQQKWPSSVSHLVNAMNFPVELPRRRACIIASHRIASHRDVGLLC
jgi:hypothetical protein